MPKRRRHSRASVPSLDVGLAWYDATQWAKLKEVAADAANLDESHEAWQRGAEKLERDLRQKGIEIHREPIDVDSLVAWCAAAKRPVDGKARAEYVGELARRRAES